MHSDSRSSSSRARHPAPTEPFQTEFARRVERWRRLRARATRKPSPGAVHDLRVATLRLQAGIEYWAGQRHDHSLTRRAARWIAFARKLRDVLGPLSAMLDVTLKKLKSLGVDILGSNGGAPGDGSEWLRQVDRLKASGKASARRAGTRELVDWLEKRARAWRG